MKTYSSREIRAEIVDCYDGALLLVEERLHEAHRADLLVEREVLSLKKDSF